MSSRPPTPRGRFLDHWILVQPGRVCHKPIHTFFSLLHLFLHFCSLFFVGVLVLVSAVFSLVVNVFTMFCVCFAIWMVGEKRFLQGILTVFLVVCSLFRSEITVGEWRLVWDGGMVVSMAFCHVLRFSFVDMAKVTKPSRTVVRIQE